MIIEKLNKTETAIKKAAEVIRKGGLVVFPSDTVYILAVDPTNQGAVDKLLSFKNRWTGKAISIAVANELMAENYVFLNRKDKILYKNLLPGPFTIVNKGKARVAKGIEAENGTLGIRIPNNREIERLIKMVGGPITATSANLSGRKSNYSAEGFVKTLPKKKLEMIDLVIDAGKLAKNKPSTVIEASGSEIKILRRGELNLGKGAKFVSIKEKETEKLAEFVMGKIMAKQKREKAIVLGLSGDLGCGKTVFSRGVGKYLKVKERITSPTFFIYNEYRANYGSKNDVLINKFIHMDLYRINSESELEEIDFKKLFLKNRVVCIEWPENMGKKYFNWMIKNVNYTAVEFSYLSEKEREIRYFLD